jgi:hypothetical protein
MSKLPPSESVDSGGAGAENDAVVVKTKPNRNQTIGTDSASESRHFG